MSRLLLPLLLLFLCLGRQAAAADNVATEFSPVTGETRCPVCGMFVGRYQQWLTQVQMSDGTIATFDGVKDMAAFTFSPEIFGAAVGATVQEIIVKDYYSQTWTDGRKASYVIGSDVHGPMGHELIPFSGRDGAENFMKDHGGTKILSFAEITQETVESLRHGHTMKGQGKPGMSQ